jgi:hypothetical protein
MGRSQTWYEIWPFRIRASIINRPMLSVVTFSGRLFVAFASDRSVLARHLDILGKTKRPFPED